MRRPVVILMAAGVLLLLSGRSATAHEFWIEMSAYHIPAGSLAAAALRVGEGFRGEPVIRDGSRFERFAALGPSGLVDLPGLEGRDPAGFLRPAEPGTYVIGYRSRAARIELEADRFEEYLRAKGLEEIIEKRAVLGERLAPGREVYSRCAKALLSVGDGPHTGARRALGFPLEIVPQDDSVETTSGPVPLRILYRGESLEGALVVAMRRGDPGTRLQARSDAEGLVALAMDEAGVWLVDTVHMVEAGPGNPAEWESLWASLTLERRPAR